MPDPSLPPDWMIREYLDRSRSLLDSIFATPEQGIEAPPNGLTRTHRWGRNAGKVHATGRTRGDATMPQGRYIPSGDTRIAYGVNCVWWDSIQNVGAIKVPESAGGGRLPCCPKCGGVLMEVPAIENWNANMAAYENDGHPGYVAMMNWGRGQCFRTMTALKAAYDSHCEVARLTVEIKKLENDKPE